MATFSVILVSLYVIATVSEVAFAGEWCYEYGYAGGHTQSFTTKYCDSSCCGNKHNQYCCEHIDLLPIIVGVVCGVVFLCIIIPIIRCCVAQYKKNRTVPLVQPAVAYVNTYPQGYSVAPPQQVSSVFSAQRYGGNFSQPPSNLGVNNQPPISTPIS